LSLAEGADAGTERDWLALASGARRSMATEKDCFASSLLTFHSPFGARLSVLFIQLGGVSSVGPDSLLSDPALHSLISTGLARSTIWPGVL
jgi:hypothetical protein